MARLSRKEKDDYFAARDVFIAEIARSIGNKVLVLDTDGATVARATIISPADAPEERLP